MAARIPQAFIDELMNRVDIVDVIESRVPLRKVGREYVACCPFHSEKTPSFTVSPTKQFYHCFGCGAHGTAIGFLMDYEHVDFVEAVEDLAARVGLTVPRETGDAAPDHRTDLYGVLEEAALFYRRQLREHPEARRAVDYLKGRGVSGEIAARYGLGFAPPGWDNLLRALGKDTTRRKRLVQAGLVVEKPEGGYDRFRERILFPIRDRRGRVIAFGGRVLGDGTPKYLNSPETPVFHKGSELYGLFEARSALRKLERILVVEGYMDVIALAQHGIQYAVATLGTATTREHLERLYRMVPEVVFCFDGDRAGREAAWRALENTLPVMRDGRQARFLFLPEGEDPDTLVRKEGREAFEARIVRAVPLSAFFLQGLAGRVDMESVDGRARMVELARPLLSKLPDGIFRQMMLDRLADAVGMDPERLARHLRGESPPAARSTPPAAGKGLARTSVRTAVALLLHRPALAQEVEDVAWLTGLRMPGVPLLVRLLELLRDQPHITTGAILERWRDSEDGKHLARLAGWRLDVPEEGVRAEFLDALDRLRARYIDQRTEQLLEAARGRQLDADEKAELKQLLAVKRREDGRQGAGKSNRSSVD